jgi:O-antigen/teichoic acid export membrane protein
MEGPSTPSARQAVRGAATVFSDSLWLSVARGAAIALALASALITTHILVPAQYAVLAYFTVVSLLIYTATSGWTATALIRYGREELEERGELRSANWNRLALTAPLVLVAAALVVALKAAGALPHAFTWAFVWLSLAAGALLIVCQQCVGLLVAGGRMKVGAVGLTARQAVGVAALLVILIGGEGRSPLVLATITVCTGVATAIVLVAVVWRAAMWPPTIDAVLMRRMVRFSVPLIALTLGQYVISSVDLVILSAFTTPHATGIYALAYQAYTVLQSVAGTATMVLAPLFVSLRSAGREVLVERYFDRVVHQLAFLGSVAAGVVVPLLRPVIAIVFGSRFEDASEPLALLFVALVLFGFASLVAPVLLLHERSRPLGLATVVAAVVNVVGDVLLVGVFDVGIVGPAIATVVSMAVIAVSYFVAARGLLRSRTRLRPVILVPLAAGLVPVLALPAAPAAAVGIPAAIVVGLAIARWTHLVAPEDADVIERLDMPPFLKRLTLRGLEFAAH